MIHRAERMYGVKPELVAIVLGAGVSTHFVVTAGLRTKAEQIQMVARGKSQTLDSKHLTGDAVDLAVCDARGVVTWEFDAYRELAKVMYGVAMDHGVRIKWGGEWSTLRDGPHFELVGGTDGLPRETTHV